MPPVTCSTYELVYQPGGVATCNVYSSWPLLMADRGTIAGPVRIVFDGSLNGGICPIPTGVWQFQATDTFVSAVGGQTQVTFANGAQWLWPQSITIEGLTIISNSNSPILVPQQVLNQTCVLIADRGASLFRNGAGSALIHWTQDIGVSGPFVFAGITAAGFGDGAGPIIDVDSLGDTVNPAVFFICLGSQTFVADDVAKSIGTTVGLVLTTSMQDSGLSENQPSWTGSPVNWGLGWLTPGFEITWRPGQPSEPAKGIFANFANLYNALINGFGGTSPISNRWDYVVRYDFASTGGVNTLPAGSFSFGGRCVWRGTGEDGRPFGTATELRISGALTTLVDGVQGWESMDVVSTADGFTPPVVLDQSNHFARLGARFRRLDDPLFRVLPGTLPNVARLFLDHSSMDSVVARVDANAGLELCLLDGANCETNCVVATDPTSQVRVMIDGDGSRIAPFIGWTGVSPIPCQDTEKREVFARFGGTPSALGSGAGPVDYWLLPDGGAGEGSTMPLADFASVQIGTGGAPAASVLYMSFLGLTPDAGVFDYPYRESQEFAGTKRMLTTLHTWMDGATEPGPVPATIDVLVNGIPVPGLSLAVDFQTFGGGAAIATNAVPLQLSDAVSLRITLGGNPTTGVDARLYARVEVTNVQNANQQQVIYHNNGRTRVLRELVAWADGQGDSGGATVEIRAFVNAVLVANLAIDLASAGGGSFLLPDLVVVQPSDAITIAARFPAPITRTSAVYATLSST